MTLCPIVIMLGLGWCPEGPIWVRPLSFSHSITIDKDESFDLCLLNHNLGVEKEIQSMNHTVHRISDQSMHIVHTIKALQT